MLEQKCYDDVPSLGPKWLNCPEWDFFLEKSYIIFMYFLASLMVQNFKKKSFEQILSYHYSSFLGLKWPIRP